jgi:hypothetical protein
MSPGWRPAGELGMVQAHGRYSAARAPAPSSCERWCHVTCSRRRHVVGAAKILDECLTADEEKQTS